MRIKKRDKMTITYEQLVKLLTCFGEKCQSENILNVQQYADQIANLQERTGDAFPDK